MKLSLFKSQNVFNRGLSVQILSFHDKEHTDVTVVEDYSFMKSNVKKHEQGIQMALFMYNRTLLTN